MNSTHRFVAPLVFAGLLTASGCGTSSVAAPKQPPTAQPSGAPLAIAYPTPVFVGTPPKQPPGAKLDTRQGPRPPYMAPLDVVVVSRNRPVTTSDQAPIIGEIDQITDGDKEGASGAYVEFGPGPQWAQVDLGKPHEVYPILIWFYHGDPRIYRDVIVRVSDDAEFKQNVRTLFNNDFDNSAGLGIGTDYEFYETYEGKLVDGWRDGKPTIARYIRVYSNGSTVDEMNRFTEVEVWGRPVQ